MNKRILLIMIILNLIYFILLAVIYYFGFDLQWGFSRNALTWGLPVALASLFALISGIITFKKSSSKWGILGLIISVYAIIYIVIMLYNFSYLLLPQQDTIYQENPPIEENTIISMILTEQFNNGGYTIVSPYTVMPERPDNTNPDYKNLIEHLFKINQTSEKLNLNSSPQNGYYIDYDEIFSRYQRIAGLSDVPLRWILFHPQAESSTKISKPAYDPETGYFLIYIQHVSSSIIRPGGSGGIYIYRYKDGELTLVDYLWGWIR